MESVGADSQQYPYRAWLPAPLYWPFRAIRTLGVAFCFAAFWLGTLIVGWLWLPLITLWPGTRVQKMHRSLRAARHGFQLFHFVMRALRLYHRTSPVAALRPGDSPVVIVANHPTLCDVTSIMSLFPNIVAVAGVGYTSHPLLRGVLRRCGFVPTSVRVMQECEDRLRMGFDVLVFPEGTRTPMGGPLHPFHRGAFELAARARVPLVLVKLRCAPPALSKRLPIWKISDRMAVLTIEPFETLHPSKTRLSSRALTREIEQRYRKILGYSDPAVAARSPQPLGDVQ